MLVYLIVLVGGLVYLIVLLGDGAGKSSFTTSELLNDAPVLPKRSEFVLV